MADARTERWVAHRAEVRERLVVSAMRTIDTLGPQATMRDFAREAKIQKPTLYRFFTDKAELVRAILESMRSQLHERIVTVPADPDVTVGDFVHSCVAAYLQAVHEHPNMFRLAVQIMAETPDLEGEHIARRATISDDVAAILRRMITTFGGTGTDVELDAQMIVGSVMIGGHWWLEHGTANIQFDHLLDRVTKTVRAMIQATAHANRIHIDFDTPIAVVSSTAE
ncbi:TetR/AcrR family transcriptional regulator [Nocardia sp. BSTN01]|uniref:TetR/AcrR family transcriptional regulator n=1 Tax=Nocardia sp. BSTN01 TaxID=2783665 RepID=UPI001890A474|nr:TetR/AcrR family transcriptional regulator [Nocardia sp. BSTN01]MBF5000509.1 TetR/AcrR family transcriptional regulator [Nocardia sp. BSTN01]